MFVPPPGSDPEAGDNRPLHPTTPIRYDGVTITPQGWIEHLFGIPLSVKFWYKDAGRGGWVPGSLER